MAILVGLEGSTSTASAIEVAIEIARRLGGSLVGLAIVDEPDIVAGEPIGIGGSSFKRDRDTALLADAQARAREWSEQFEARCRAAGVPASTLQRTGHPAELLVEEIQRHDLTVLGRDANFRFETQERDRATRDRILRRAGKPILVVPPDQVAAGPTVLIAYDGSPAATRALRSFGASGLARGRPIRVASVQDDGAVAFEIATRGCEILRDLGIPAEPDNIVSVATTTEALLARCAVLDAGLIVIGGYVRAPLVRMVWGSVTHGVVENAVVPVFLHY